MGICMHNQEVPCSVSMEEHKASGVYCRCCIHGSNADPEVLFMPYYGFEQKRKLCPEEGVPSKDFPF